MPLKNIRPLHGKPLMAYTVNVAQECTLLNDVMVSTDSSIIANAAKDMGVSFIVNRPDELATDTASKWPVFIHALEAYEKKHGIVIDYLADMDVTVPLKSAADIEGAIKMALEDATTDVVITAYEPERNPYFNMMETGEDGYAHIVKKTVVPIVRRQDAPKVYSLCPAAYIIKKEALYKYSHWSEAICKLYIMPRERAVDIDTEFDFKLVEFLMKQL